MSRDTWTGLFTLLVGLLAWFEAGKISSSPLDDAVGASGHPKALAIALIALSVLLVLREATLSVLSRDPPAESMQAEPHSGQHLRAAGLLLVGCGYLFLVTWVGYTLSIALFLLSVSLYCGAGLSLRTVVFAAVGAGMAHLVFVDLLAIPQPEAYVLPWLVGS